MDICGTDNLLELKEGQAGPGGSDGTGEVTEILSIRGALSVPYDRLASGQPPKTNGNATHSFSEIIRTKTVADPSGVFQVIESADFTVKGSGTPTSKAIITFANFLNVPAKLFSCHINLNAIVATKSATKIDSGTSLPAITDSSVGQSEVFIKVMSLEIEDINEDKIVIVIRKSSDNSILTWGQIVTELFHHGLYYSLTIFAVKN